MSRGFRVGRTTVLESWRRKESRFNIVALQLTKLVQNANLDVALIYLLRWSWNLEEARDLVI